MIPVLRCARHTLGELSADANAPLWRELSSVRFADALWILDYKRSADEQDSAGYRRQLDGYRNALQAVAGALPVHTALITVDGRLWQFD